MKATCLVLLLAATISLMGCSEGRIRFRDRPATFTGTGADWDEDATGSTNVVFIAGYPSFQPYVRQISIGIPRGASAEWVAEEHERLWNTAYPDAKVERCKSDKTIVMYPGASELVVVDGAAKAHRLSNWRRRIHGNLRVSKQSCQ